MVLVTDSDILTLLAQLTCMMDLFKLLSRSRLKSCGGKNIVQFVSTFLATSTLHQQCNIEIYYIHKDLINE